MGGPVSGSDIAIVGAGPAGLLAAALLARDFSVVVADPRPIGAAKSCAGLLSIEAQGLLARLGEPEGFYDEPARLELRVFLRGRELPARPFFNVERGALQAWMAAKAEAAGATVARAAFRSASRAPRGWDLVFDDGKGVRASILVGADGVASSTRRSLGLGSVSVVSARQSVFEGRIDAAVLILERDSDGAYYCWAVPKRGGVLVGAADPAGFPDRALRSLSATLPGFSPGAQVAQERGAYTRVRSVEEVALGVPGAFLIGEAAGLVMPSSGEGLGGALESAAALSKVLKEIGIDGARPDGPDAAVALDRYRAVLSPRLDRIAADIAFAASFGAGS